MAAGVLSLLLITFCNQNGARRPFGLAAVEPDSARFHWIGLGAGRKDMGATGFVSQDGLFYVAVQSQEPRLAAFDPATWRLVAANPFARVRDPHSLAARSDGLYIASTGDNAVYRLAVDRGVLKSEELIWRHPGSSEIRDDVHVNSLAFAGERLLVTGFGPRADGGSWGADGFVLDAASGERLVSGLNHPHSLVCDGARIAVAESYAGRVRLGAHGENGVSFSQAIDVPGYPRGLAFDGGSLLVGSSVTRKISRSTSAPLQHKQPQHDRSTLFRLDLKSLALEPILDCTHHGHEIYEIGLSGGPLPPASAGPSLWETLAAKLAGLTA
jgi:hypothetical protein